MKRMDETMFTAVTVAAWTMGIGPLRALLRVFG